MDKKEKILRAIDSFHNRSSWMAIEVAERIGETNPKSISYVLVPLVQLGYVTIEKRRFYRVIEGKNVLDWVEKSFPRIQKAKSEKSIPNKKKVFCKSMKDKMNMFSKDLQALLDYTKELEEKNQKLESESQDLYRQFCDLHKKLHKTPRRLELDEECD